MAAPPSEAKPKGNPLLVVGAFGCGLVWSFLRFRTGRLVVAVLSHAIFSWAIVEFPLWKP